MKAFSARKLYTPTAEIEHPLLLVDNGVISRLASRRELELPAGTELQDFCEGAIFPGFLDIHVHGGAGHDVMDANPSQQVAFEMSLMADGVTAYLPTTVTAPLDRTLTALDNLATSIEQHDKDPAYRSRPLGIHLEGPFISHARRGVHPPAHLLPPTIATFDRLWQAARGRITMMTIAPELEGASEVIAEASRRGVCVSLGHSDADLTSSRHGFAAGARHATHTFNAMRPLDHRAPGILGAVLTDSGVSADIIADGVHLEPVIVQLFLRAKGPDNAVLITDAIAATGMPDGLYWLGKIAVEVKNGVCTAEGRLAGSVLTMNQAIRNVMKFAGWSLQDSVRLATANPARTIRATHRGRLVEGSQADFVVLDPTGKVLQTVIHGKITTQNRRVHG